MVDVEMRELPPMRVACALGFGTEPELEAWQHIQEFAERNGLDMSDGTHRYFGFNNPNPSPGSPNYGYEQWMTVGDDVEASGAVTLKEIPAGRYAVTRFRGLENITPTWKRFVQWFEESGLEWGSHCDCLEELLTPIGAPPEQWVFDLYLPVAPEE